jgi:ankyrin repeat protein
LVKLLVAAGARIDPETEEEMGAVASAAWGGHLQIVKYLVEEAGADVWHAGYRGEMPLMWAADNGHADVVAYLLDRPGMDMDVRQRALGIACRNGHLQVVQLMVAAGAKVELQGRVGMGAVAEAAYGGHLQIVRYLVEEAGADEGRPDSDGFTPLMWAADNGHADVVGYLLGRPGLSMHAETERGERAIDFATFQGHQEVVALFVAAEAGVKLRAEFGAGVLAPATAGDSLGVDNHVVGKAGAEECAVPGISGTTRFTHMHQVRVMRYICDPL